MEFLVLFLWAFFGFVGLVLVRFGLCNFLMVLEDLNLRLGENFIIKQYNPSIFCFIL